MQPHKGSVLDARVKLPKAAIHWDGLSVGIREYRQQQLLVPASH
jgi:hypothetical protein